MCDCFAQEDDRICVIHKRNGGLSDARNCGMEVCKGEYLFFVDSDDFIKKDAVDLLLREAVATNADLVCGDYCSIDENGNLIGHGLGYPFSELTTEEAIDFFITKSWGAWGKLYKKKIHCGLMFPVGKIHEDEAIMLQILARCSKIVLLANELYFYMQRKDSITAQKYSKKKMDWFYGWEQNTLFIEHHYPQYLSKCICKAWDTALYNIGHLIGRQENRSELEDLYRFAKKYQRNIFCSREVSFSRKLRLLLFLYSNLTAPNNLYCRFYRAIKRM